MTSAAPLFVVLSFFSHRKEGETRAQRRSCLKGLQRLYEFSNSPLKWHFGLKMKILKFLGISSTYSSYDHFVPMILCSMSHHTTHMEHKNVVVILLFQAGL